MKALLLTTSIALLNVASASAQDSLAPYHPTAFQSATGVEQIGLLSDSRAGFGDRYTLSAHPLVFFVAPTVELSITWDEDLSSAWSTTHRLGVPTPLMMLVQKRGDLGLITPEASIGFILSVTNGARYSMRHDNATFSVEGAVEVAIGDPDPRTTIDLPIVYPRMVAYYDGWLAEAAAVYEGPISKHFSWSFTTRVFANDTKFFAELTPRLTWVIGDRWALHIDPVVTYGTYPFGNQWQLLILPDLTYRF